MLSGHRCCSNHISVLFTRRRATKSWVLGLRCRGVENPVLHFVPNYSFLLYTRLIPQGALLNFETIALESA